MEFSSRHRHRHRYRYRFRHRFRPCPRLHHAAGILTCRSATINRGKATLTSDKVAINRTAGALLSSSSFSSSSSSSLFYLTQNPQKTQNYQSSSRYSRWRWNPQTLSQASPRLPCGVLAHRSSVFTASAVAGLARATNSAD